MRDMTHAGDKDLCLEQIIVIDQPNVFNQLHTVKAVVIVTTDKRADEGRSGLCCKQRLIG